MSVEYFASLVSLPILIDETGLYLARSGERVVVDEASRKHDFGCVGRYENDFTDCWHRSGRLFASGPSQNDIVAKGPK